MSTLTLGFKDPRRMAFDNVLEQRWNRNGTMMHDAPERAKQRDALWKALDPKLAGLDERRVALYAEEYFKAADRGPLTDAEHQERNAATTGTVVGGFAAGAKMASAAREIREHNEKAEPGVHALLHDPAAPGLGSSPRIVADQLEQHGKRVSDRAKTI